MLPFRFYVTLYVEDITRVRGLYRLNINPDCDSRRDLYEGTV